MKYKHHDGDDRRRKRQDDACEILPVCDSVHTPQLHTVHPGILFLHKGAANNHVRYAEARNDHNHPVVVQSQRLINQNWA